MPTLKYFEKIDARKKRDGQQQIMVPDFDIDEFASNGILTRFGSWLFETAMLTAFFLFRIFCPNPQFGRLVLVTRDHDVRQVLTDNQFFKVPFEKEMEEMAADCGSVLGLDDEIQEKWHGIIEEVVRKNDIDRIRALTKQVAKRQIETSGGQLDVMKDFITRVAAEVCIEYLGLDVDDPDLFAGYTMSISMLLFADPFGNERTYQLARRAAFNVRQIVDRSIARAHACAQGGSSSDSIVARLVAHQASNPLVTNGMIRANLMGLATGLVPTITLSAGKVFQELMRRPSAMADATERARSGDNAGLRKYLLEAARLNPALSPGQWRYAAKSRVIAPGTMRAKYVAEGSILLVATASALRDWRRFPFPGRFSPDRKHAPDLIFGFGPHQCLGEHVALAQMEEMFGVLLPQTGLRRFDGPTGQLSSVGPFPRRLDVEFETELSPVRQSMLVFCAPVPKDNVTKLTTLVTGLGNPASDDVAETLEDTRIVHFASMSVINAGSDDEAAPYLVFELNVDGSGAHAIETIAKEAKAWLGPIFACTVGGTSPSLADALSRHARDLQTLPWGATGLNFNGTPEFPVCDILRQAKLISFARAALKHYEENHFGLGSRATVALDYVRDFIDQNERFVAYADNPKAPEDDRKRVRELLDRGREFADFLMRPSRRRLKISDWSERTNWDALVSFVSSRSVKPFATALATIFFSSSLVVYLCLDTIASSPVARIVLAVEYGLIATIVFVSALIATFLGLLRWNETCDVPEDREAKLAVAEQALREENHPGYVQNHFTAVTQLKSGWFRKLTLALALWSIKQLVLHRYRPGFVLNMGTIHYARWFRVPNTEKLVFLSNFDGSWESYLEDFVMKAHAGQSAAWSNGLGFPRTRFLIYGGAQDGDRFKRWVRRQQVSSQFWYSRFPGLTTDQIRNNAMIHDGLMRARTETAARAWLDCFGSMPRPDYSIETDEVQSIVFRGMGELLYAACAIVRLPQNAEVGRRWLGNAMQDVRFSPQSGDGHPAPQLALLAFGDRVHDSATFIGFSASGLIKLGIPKSDDSDGMSTFPSAFRIGMTRRDKILGDFGPSAPKEWLWADGDRGTETGADAVLIVYAKSAQECDDLLERHAQGLGGRDTAFLHEILMSPANDGKLDTNHFGFRDGISQPVIKGTERFNTATPPRDIVEPGEFILGYRNNQGFFPPTPTVSPQSDVEQSLSPIPAGAYSRFPGFASAPPNTRDFGRNGTFLVIRQLVQHVEKFEELTKSKAEDLRRCIDSATIGNEKITADWIAAKMMGRKRDGTPLIQGASSTDYNDFSYGLDDPQGLSCPFGAHIRRANPRDSLQPLDPSQQEITNRHRLMRRGRSYLKRKTEEDAVDEKGLLFMCLCADIERQFEFVQQSWIGSPVFHGLNQEPDPIAASWMSPAKSLGSDPSSAAGSPTSYESNPKPGSIATSTPREAGRGFTIPTISGSVVLENMESVVTTVGGGYFFLPSLSAMRYLVGLSATSPLRSHSENK